MVYIDLVTITLDLKEMQELVQNLHRSSYHNPRSYIKSYARIKSNIKNCCVVYIDLVSIKKCKNWCRICTDQVTVIQDLTLNLMLEFLKIHT